MIIISKLHLGRRPTVHLCILAVQTTHLSNDLEAFDDYPAAFIAPNTHQHSGGRSVIDNGPEVKPWKRPTVHLRILTVQTIWQNFTPNFSVTGLCP